MVYYARRVSSRARAYGRSVRRRRSIGMARRRTAPRRSRASRPMRVATSPTTTAATNIYKLLQGPASAFPRSVKARLRYADELTWQHNTGSSDTEILRLNSLYDPWYATGGHQPRYFDQLCGQGLYLHYMVIGVKYTIEIPSQNSGLPLFVLVRCSLSPTSIGTDIQTVAEGSELPYSQLVQQDRGSKTTISGYIKIADLFGIKQSELESNWVSYGGSYGADPPSQCYILITVVPADHSGSTETTYGVISMEFDAIFNDRDNAPIS